MDFFEQNGLIPDERFLALVFLLVAIILPAFITIRSKDRNRRLRKKIERGKYIYWQDFCEDWIIEKKTGNMSGKGYKYETYPGCYVIKLFDDLILDGNYKKYENIYIGQSLNVCQRVHNHLLGKGKGDVYADIKYGYEAYVQIIPCSERDLNKLEKELIECYDATDSYNVTKGGATVRDQKRKLFRK